MSGNDGRGQQDTELARTTTIVLAEFAGLRSEIAVRISILITLMLGNLTVVGVVFGIALSRPGNTSVLLLLPLVTPCVGILFIDTFRNLGFLGRYIATVIRPQLQIRSLLKPEGMRVFDWERWAARHQFTLGIAGPFIFVAAAEFLGPPIAVLAYAINYHLQHPHVQVSTIQLAVWWAGVVLTGLPMLFAIVYGGYSAFHPQGSRKIRLGHERIAAVTAGRGR